MWQKDVTAERSLRNAWMDCKIIQSTIMSFLHMQSRGNNQCVMLNAWSYRN